jgi:transposase-like protein
MDPRTQFCHNPSCHARGKAGEGNIVIHSQKEKRYQCNLCDATFAATKGTPFFRLQTDPEAVTIVLTLLGHGCPLQAVVAAFGFDERTVTRWLSRAGGHCQKVHEHLVQQSGVDLRHVQADEMWVKLVGQKVWLAMAMAVPSRLWLGGVISPKRDLVLITTLVKLVRSCGQSLAILVCVDGLASYVTAFFKVFREPVPTGRSGRPRLKLEEGLLLGQVIKSRAKKRVVSVTQRAMRGSLEAINEVLAATGTGKGINTAYIERLNATFRASLAVLVRRGRAIAHQQVNLTAGMNLVGCAYNFCWHHESLRLAAPEGSERKWLHRTPAMAAGLTDHRWSMLALLNYQVPLPAWAAPKRRGRPPKEANQRVMAVAA